MVFYIIVKNLILIIALCWLSFMLSVPLKPNMLRVIMLSVVMVSVVAPFLEDG
jgi:hypothetical protein